MCRKSFSWIFIMIFLVCFPLTVSAHAYIVKSSPAPNETLTTAPTQVRIQFDEPIQAVFDSLSVNDQSGNRVDLNNAHVNQMNPSILECGLKPGLGNGLYTINWKVISGDGHPVQGLIPFSIGSVQQSVQTRHASTAGYIPAPDMIFIRWIQYIGLMLYVGTLFFYYTVLPKELREVNKVKNRLRKSMWAFWGISALSILLSLPLQTTIDSNVSWLQAFSPSLLQKNLMLTNFGHVWMLQLLLALVLLPVTSFGLKKGASITKWPWAIAAVLSVGLLLTKSMTSHLAATFAPELSITTDFLHLLTVSIWIGSLFGMVVLLPRSKEFMASEHKEVYWTTIRRFSPWGIVSVSTIIATGLYATYLNVPNIQSLLITHYGQTLLVKLSLFLMMLILAVYHFLQGKKHEHTDKSGIFRTIWAEFSIGAVILGIVALLTNLPTAMSTPGPFTGTQRLTNDLYVTLHVSPNVAGVNTFDVDLKTKEGQPEQDVQQVTLTLSSLDIDMGNNTVITPMVAPGKFHTQGMYVTTAGHWLIHVHILTKSLQDLDTNFQFVVGSP